jgi:mannose-6-phosphate isomerase
MNEIFTSVRQDLMAKGFQITDEDLQKPWGGYFCIDEKQSAQFANTYFLQHEFMKLPGITLTPNILMIAPGQELSWQYHLHRGEAWHVIQGPVGVKQSYNDTEGRSVRFESGSGIEILPKERHRLIGLESWAVVAELWEVRDNKHPTNEADIIRVQDDYGR